MLPPGSNSRSFVDELRQGTTWSILDAGSPPTTRRNGTRNHRLKKSPDLCSPIVSVKMKSATVAYRLRTNFLKLQRLCRILRIVFSTSCASSMAGDVPNDIEKTTLNFGRRGKSESQLVRHRLQFRLATREALQTTAGTDVWPALKIRVERRRQRPRNPIDRVRSIRRMSRTSRARPAAPGPVEAWSFCATCSARPRHRIGETTGSPSSTRPRTWGLIKSI